MNEVLQDYANRLSELSLAYQRFVLAKQAQFSALLEQYREDLVGLSSIYQTLPAPIPRILTVPEIFNKTFNENFISDYLAYVLNPNKNGIGKAPLQKFMGFISSETDFSNFEKVEIIREYPLEQGRIDILLILDDSLVIGIENKIFADEGIGQTLYYEEKMEKLFKDYRRCYVFLTMDGKSATSKHFLALSYSQLLTAFQTVEIPYGNLTQKALWEDFLRHVEAHLTMNAKRLDIPEPEKLSLYLKHHKMLSDLRLTYENSRDAIFHSLCEEIQQVYDDLDWVFNFNPTRPWQLLYKPHWYLQKPPLRVMQVLWFSKDILITEDFLISIEVQGYEKWDTQEEIPQFFSLFRHRYEELKPAYRQKGISYLTPIRDRPQLAKIGLAWKRFPLTVDPDHLETVVQQITQAKDEFDFLIAPIEETIREIRVDE